MPLGDASSLRTHLARFGGELCQGAVGVRDRALRLAQSVARLAARFFLFAQIAVQRFDAAAQRLQVFFLRCSPGCAGSDAGQKKGEAPQAFAFPWAATEARRRATSSGSPR